MSNILDVGLLHKTQWREDMIISVRKINNIHNDGENNGTSEARLLRCCRIRLRWKDGEQPGAHVKLLPPLHLDQKVGHILDVLCVIAERTAAFDLHPNLLTAAARHVVPRQISHGGKLLEKTRLGNKPTSLVA